LIVELILLLDIELSLIFILDVFRAIVYVRDPMFTKYKINLQY